MSIYSDTKKNTWLPVVLWSAIAVIVIVALLLGAPDGILMADEVLEQEAKL